MAVVGPEEKICPMCAETVKAAAVRCRFCGYDFSGRAPTLPQSSAGGEGLADAIGGTMMKFGLVALAMIGLVAYCSSSTEEVVAPVAPSAPAPTLSAEQRADCAKILGQAEHAGVVRQIEPSLMRLTVDEPGWRELGPTARVGVMAAAACDWFGVKMSGLGESQRVTIVGWQSGDRLASSMGGLYTGD